MEGNDGTMRDTPESPKRRTNPLGMLPKQQAPNPSNPSTKRTKIALYLAILDSSEVAAAGEGSQTWHGPAYEAGRRAATGEARYETIERPSRSETARVLESTLSVLCWLYAL